MYYINLFIIALILTSCSTTKESGVAEESGISPLTQSVYEVNRYKTAINLLNNNKLDAAKKYFLSLNLKDLS